MENQLRNLPTGIQDFEKLRNQNCLYVDKTEHVYNLANGYKPYFLSRPRRFGKSLLISTFDALFNGKKNLFEGLFIYDKWDWTQKYPVIKIDFGGSNYDSPENLITDFNEIIESYAKQYNIVLTRKNSGAFAELIKKLHETTKQQVVILIDEYDKPIIDYLSDLEIADKNRKILHDFYQVMKAEDAHIRFIFLTGVSKFSQVSIFSGLNNLTDLTVDSRYSTICGYTQQELESNFADHILELAKENNITKEKCIDEIKYWYDGYSWDGKNFVYNPFSTLKLFDVRIFKDHWFASSSPSFLVELISKTKQLKPLSEDLIFTDSSFNSFNIEKIDVNILLFQTGYLTIKRTERDKFSLIYYYILNIPNNEVKIALSEHLLANFADKEITELPTYIRQMKMGLLNGNPEELERQLKSLLANIPYQLHIEKEAYYHSLFLLWLNLLGFKIDAEVSTNQGRIDAVWQWEDRVVVCEVKYSAKRVKINDLLNQAMEQIKVQKYYEKYLSENKNVALLAVAFTGKNVSCRMEELSIINYQLSIRN
jgi:Holliday junction resolvase-like predicted endonuclease